MGNHLEFISETLASDFQKDLKSATAQELHQAIATYIMAKLSDTWRESEEKQRKGKRAFYFSAEFLVGRAVYNNLLAMKMTGEVNEYLRGAGADLSALEEIEDAALGNGGLGRLAACFLDSAATVG